MSTERASSFTSNGSKRRKLIDFTFRSSRSSLATDGVVVQSGTESSAGIEQGPPTATQNSTPAATQSSTPAATQSSTLASSRLETIGGRKIIRKPVSQDVNHSFQDALKQLSKPLFDYIRKPSTSLGMISIRLVLLEDVQQIAKPCMVVFCPEDLNDRIEKFFVTDLAQRVCQPKQTNTISFDVYVVDKAPVRRATDYDLRVFGQPLFDNPSRDQHAWATPIKLESHGKERFATMGGFIRVTAKAGTTTLYGLTVGHVLPDDCTNNSGLPEGFSIHHASQDAASNGESTKTDTQDEVASWEELGSVSLTVFSQRARNRDWALIDFSNASFWPESHNTETRTYETSHSMTSEVVQLSHDENIVGEISDVPIVALLPFGDEFVRVHTVTLGDANGTSSWPLAAHADQVAYLDGTSGTWVVQWAGLVCRVFGHLIAEDPLGDVYMVPMTDILKDIEFELYALRVEVPTTHEDVDHYFNQLAKPDPAGLVTTASSKQPSSESTADTAVAPPISSTSKGPYLRWTCSECLADCSFDLNVACWNCQHWRCSTCGVYEVRWK